MFFLFWTARRLNYRFSLLGLLDQFQQKIKLHKLHMRRILWQARKWEAYVSHFVINVNNFLQKKGNMKNSWNINLNFVSIFLVHQY